MLDEILKIVTEISPEEQRILSGDQTIQKDLYTSDSKFIVDCSKFLEAGRWIDARMHTRFTYFPPHQHNYIEMVYMLSGSLTTTIDQTDTIKMKEGDILILNQKAVHDILPCGKNDLAVNFLIMPEFFGRSTMFLDRGNLVKDFFISTLSKAKDSNNTNIVKTNFDLTEHPTNADKNVCNYLLFHSKDAPPVTNLIENLLWNLLIQKRGMSSINQTTMALLFMNLSILSSNIRSKETNNVRDVVLTVLEYIDGNFINGTLEEIAKQTGYSTYYLSRLLKAQTGKNFKNLLQNRKLQQASFLLSNTTMSIDQVIANIGYENTSYFYHIFKDKYGLSPSEYRNKYLMHSENEM